MELDARVMKQNGIEPDPSTGPLRELVRERIVQMVVENEVFKEKL